MNNITFVPEDGTLIINGDVLTGIDPIYFSWVPSDVHAYHWYGEELGADIEFKHPNPFENKRPNERVMELGEWAQLIDLHTEEKQRREDARISAAQAIEASRDYWEEFRQIRDSKLFFSDWTQILDVPLTQEEKDQWAIYRQQLRDLPEIITDPKPMVVAYNNGEIHPDWPISPQ